MSTCREKFSVSVRLALILGVVFWCFLTRVDQVFACASCGSGGDDPLILYPTEDWKAYAAYSHTDGLRTILADGREIADTGPQRKQQLTLALGKSWRSDLFTTITWGVLRNTRGGRSRSHTTDPLFSMRWTVLPASFATPWQPQLQIVAGIKPRSARSIHDSQDPDLLDVFGGGFTEGRLGADLWWGMSAIRGGAAQVYTWSRPHVFEGVRIAPGLSSRSTLTLGYGLESYDIGLAKVLVGLTREQKRQLRVDGDEIPNSDQLTQGYFVTADAMLDAVTMLRLTYSQRGVTGTNKNTARSQSVVVAAMRSF